MIYTSYFGKLKKVDKLIDGRIYVPYSIAVSTPRWFHGSRIKCLMPDFDLLTSYKGGVIDEKKYTERYQNNILSHLRPDDVILEIESFLPDTVLNRLEEMDCSITETENINVLLCCYEKIGEFCHRHVLSKWFRDKGYNVNELEL